MIPVRSQWGRYNLPGYMYVTSKHLNISCYKNTHWIFNNPSSKKKRGFHDSLIPTTYNSKPSDTNVWTLKWTHYRRVASCWEVPDLPAPSHHQNDVARLGRCLQSHGRAPRDLLEQLFHAIPAYSCILPSDSPRIPWHNICSFCGFCSLPQISPKSQWLVVHDLSQWKHLQWPPGLLDYWVSIMLKLLLLVEQANPITNHSQFYHRPNW